MDEVTSVPEQDELVAEILETATTVMDGHWTQGDYYRADNVPNIRMKAWENEHYHSLLDRALQMGRGVRMCALGGIDHCIWRVGQKYHLEVTELIELTRLVYRRLDATIDEQFPDLGLPGDGASLVLNWNDTASTTFDDLQMVFEKTARK